MATRQEFAQKVLGDETFRAELKKDPKGTMRAYGVALPDGIEIEVVESTSAKQYIVLPPLQTDELSDEQLEGAQGGTAMWLIGLVTPITDNNHPWSPEQPY